jgi:hypothetical protein
VPAAAVIPAPLAYTTIVAVKRLVVGLNIPVQYKHNFVPTLHNTVNKSECTKHVGYVH